MQNKFMGSIVALLKWKWKKCGDILGGIQPIRTAPEAALSRRDQKIARLYEQGASKERVGAYLRRWLGWAGVMGIVGVCVMFMGCADFKKELNEYPDIRIKWEDYSGYVYGIIVILVMILWRISNDKYRPR